MRWRRAARLPGRPPRRPNQRILRLQVLQGVLGLVDALLGVTLGLVGLALGLPLLVARGVAERLLGLAAELVALALHDRLLASLALQGMPPDRGEANAVRKR